MTRRTLFRSLGVAAAVLATQPSVLLPFWREVRWYRAPITAEGHLKLAWKARAANGSQWGQIVSILDWQTATPAQRKGLEAKAYQVLRLALEETRQRILARAA